MRRRLVISYLAVAAAILVMLEVPLGIVYARHEHDVASSGLQRDASALASLSEEGVEHHDTSGLATLAAHYRQTGRADVEILAADGTVLVPSASDEAELAVGSVGAKVKAALTGSTPGVAHLGDGDELFAVAPIGAANPPAGVVIATTPTHQVYGAWGLLGVFAIGAMAAAAALGLVVARSVTRPLTDLEGAALSLGGGDLGARAVEQGPAEVIALAAAFNVMAARLEELIGAQHTFVADASHQLRSPLTALRLRVENMAAAPTRGDDDVDAVLAEIDRLSRVVDGLLSLATAEGERPGRQVVDVAAIAVERRDAWAALAEEAGIDLTYTGPRGAPALWVPGHLEQIVDNLLANAVEATPPGREVAITVRAGEESTELRVVDQGRGMSPEDRSHAFDRLWRGANSGDEGGSGLGLSIVRQLARTSDAEVELREAVGGGIEAVVTSVSQRGQRT